MRTLAFAVGIAVCLTHTCGPARADLSRIFRVVLALALVAMLVVVPA